MTDEEINKLHDLLFELESCSRSYNWALDFGTQAEETKTRSEFNEAREEIFTFCEGLKPKEKSSLYKHFFGD